MRNLLLGLALGGALGAGGVLLVLRPTGEPSASESPPRGPRLEGAAIPAAEAELRRLADAWSAASRGRAGSPESPAAPAPEGGAHPTVAALREAWSERLDQSLELLRAVGPKDERDPVHWSRWDDWERARRLLDEARTLEDLKRLSEGRFRIFFRWP
jgi:hypothetical protein